MAVSEITVVCLGDVVSKPGREAIKRDLTTLRAEHSVDLAVVNAENASGGVGIVAETVDELRGAGADLITLGDHAWRRKEFRSYLDNNSAHCIRPANYPDGAPGEGWMIWTSPNGHKIGVFNLIGRVFMGAQLDCPFQKADEILNGPLKDCAVTICDLHAEATSEKYAMARYLDGRVSLLFGTHTHVQTADEQILPGGTGYITDLGLTGSGDGVIGMDSEVAKERFLTGLPSNYKPAKGEGKLRGVVVKLNLTDGKAVEIVRV